MKKIILYILIIVSSFSCEQELDKEFNNIEPQIVVNAFFCQGEPFKVFLSKSYSPFHSQRAEMIKDAQVTIFENGNNLGELTFQTEVFHRRDTIIFDLDTILAVWSFEVDSFFTNPTIIPQLGCNYRIEVNVDGFKTVWANSTVPNLVPIRSVNKKLRFTDFYGGSIEKGIPYYEIDFVDPQEPNYYLFSILALNNRAMRADDYRVAVPYYSDDPVIGKFEREYNSSDNQLFFAFSDHLFNGKDYKLSVIINEYEAFNRVYLNNENDSLLVYLQLNNLGFDFEQYIKSLRESEKQSSNPLSEPISIYSNIENGLGVFAGYACGKKPLMLHKPITYW